MASPRCATRTSQHRPDLPGVEFLFADALTLALGAFGHSATSRINSNIRRPALSTDSPSSTVPAFEVHVVDHPLVHRRIRGDLDARRRLQAEHAAAPGGENQDVRAAGHETSRAGGVITRGVHEDQARRVDPLGVIRPRRPAGSSRPSPVRPAISHKSWSRPPFLLPGEGLLLISAPKRPEYHSHHLIRSTSFSPTSRDTARRVNRCSAP